MCHIDDHVSHLARLNRRPGTIYQHERTLIRLARFIAPTPITDATIEQLRAYVDRIGRRGVQRGDSARYNEASQLTQFFRWAVTEEIIERDPTLRLERPKRKAGVPRPMPDADVRRILAEAPEPLRSWYSLAVHGGLRACEIAPVRSRDIVNNVLVIPEAKGGNTEAVPLMCIPLQTVLDNVQSKSWWFPHGTDPSRHVTAGQVSKRSNRWLREHDIEHTLHSLRHAFGTNTYRLSNYDLILTADLMRHKRLDTTRGYVALVADRATEVATAIAGHYDVDRAAVA